MTDYRQVARQSAERYGINPEYFVRQIGAESGFNPRAGSPAGAQGIAQIMPATAKGWGVDPHDPIASLDAAAKAMAKYVKSYGSYRNALVAYNAGPGRVGKPLYRETANYINKILGDGPEQSAPSARTVGGGLVAAAPQFKAPGYGKLFAGGSKSDEWFGGFLDRSIGGARARQALTAQAAPAASPATPSGGSVPAGAVGKDYRWIQQQGIKRFGLKNDPGDGQLTGGKHSDGSEHYDGRAVDFGTARNSPEQLRRWAAWARAQGLDVLNEGDHIHVSLPGSGI